MRKTFSIAGEPATIATVGGHDRWHGRGQLVARGAGRGQLGQQRAMAGRVVLEIEVAHVAPLELRAGARRPGHHGQDRKRRIQTVIVVAVEVERVGAAVVGHIEQDVVGTLA